MVHHKRSSRKSCTVMDVSPLRNSCATSLNKPELSSSPRIGYKLEVPVAKSKATPSANPWHFNDMINNNRQQFNNLHFC